MGLDHRVSGYGMNQKETQLAIRIQQSNALQGFLVMHSVLTSKKQRFNLLDKEEIHFAMKTKGKTDIIHR